MSAVKQIRQMIDGLMGTCGNGNISRNGAGINGVYGIMIYIYLLAGRGIVDLKKFPLLQALFAKYVNMEACVIGKWV